MSALLAEATSPTIIAKATSSATSTPMVETASPSATSESSIAAPSTASTVKIVHRWSRWRAAISHELAQIVWPLERFVELVVIIFVIFQTSAHFPLWYIAAVDIGRSRVMTGRSESVALAVLVECAATKPGSSTALRKLLLTLVLCFFLVVGELDFVLANFFIVDV